MPDQATLEARLAEAETALHRLSIGALSVEVEYEGLRTRYTAASEPRLRAYISALKRQLGQGGPRRSRRVVY